MKKLITILAFLASSTLFGQVITQNIPATGGSTTTFRAPNGTSAHTTHRAHYIIPASELGALPNGAKIIVAGFNYISGVDSVANGNLKFYMENTTATTNTKSTTWTTAITGMDTLFDGTYNLPVTTAAITTAFTLSDTFTYTGGGIFIAYDYLGAQFATTAAVYDCNTGVVGGLKMANSSTTTPGATLTATSNWRPMLTIKYLTPFTNDLEVNKLLVEHGHSSKIIDTNQTVVGIIKNNSIGTLTSKTVTLTVTGANPSVTTHTISSIAAGASDTITFPGLSVSTNGTQIVKLSVPSDQFTGNDSLQYDQIVSCDILGYGNNVAPYTGIGFNTGSGILAVKHEGSATIPITVKAVVANINNATAITGNTLKAVLLDTGGVIIDSSAAVVITAAQLGTNVTFPLTGNNTITTANRVFYVGIRQTANTTGYFPLSSQVPVNPLADRFFSFDEFGGNLSSSYTTLGTLMLNAVVSPSPTVTMTNSAKNDSVCLGNSVVFSAIGGSLYSSYDFEINGTSVQNSTSTNYTITPTVNFTAQVSGMYGNCPISSALTSITVVSVDTTVIVTDSTLTASTTWATYEWINCATGMTISGATSQKYQPVVTGDYKVVVTINGCSDTSNCHRITVRYAGVNELVNENISIYPNPAKDKLTVSYEGNYIQKISIIDVNGKIIVSKIPNKNKIIFDLNRLNSGFYFVKIESESAVTMRKFVKE